jgi:hypothetical protein
MIEYPDEASSPIDGADWLELCCFLEYPNEITKNMVNACLRSKDDYELFSSDIFRHIEWRKSISQNYPFVLSDAAVRSSTAPYETQEYLFPLLLATHDFYDDTKITNWSPVGDLFELFCTASITKLVGNAVLIGNTLGQFPAARALDAVLVQVCTLMNERKGLPHPMAATFQDAGVDIIGWKKLDKRKGQIVLLVQCASGKNWRKKGGDIKPRLWNELVLWTVEPIKVLTFPFAFDFDNPQEEEMWRFYSYDSGILLDRLRLINFKFAEFQPQVLNLEPINVWLRNQFEMLRRYEIEI